MRNLMNDLLAAFQFLSFTLSCQNARAGRNQPFFFFFFCLVFWRSAACLFVPVPKPVPVFAFYEAALPPTGQRKQNRLCRPRGSLGSLSRLYCQGTTELLP